jgi:acetolactate synthase-1/3 small subunit
MNTNTHTISLLVANSPGVLVRVAIVFARRGYNIDSLVVSATLDGRFSRMTITAAGDPNTLEQIIKQCNKLIDVVSVQEHDPSTTLEKEMALVKVRLSDTNRVEVLQVIQHLQHATTVDLSETTAIVYLTGNSDELDSDVKVLKKYGIIELVRTGKVLMAKGEETT